MPKTSPFILPVNLIHIIIPIKYDTPTGVAELMLEDCGIMEAY